MPKVAPYQHLDIKAVISYPKNAVALCNVIGVGERQLMLLDEHGRFVARSESLDLWHPTVNGGLASKTSTRGMAVVIDYIADDEDEYAHMEVATWFSFQKKGNSITANRLGDWSEFDLRFDINGLPWKEGYLWTGCIAGPIQGGFEGSTLILGYGKQGKVPTPYPTEIPCKATSPIFQWQDETLIVLRTGTGNKLEIWSVKDPASPYKVMDLAKAPKQTQLFNVKLLQSGDEVVAFWCEYSPGRKQVTHLKAARVDLKSTKVSKPVIVVSDEDIVGTTLIHSTIDGTEFFAWESRRRGTRIHAIRTRDILGGSHEPIRLDADAAQPLFCLEMKQPLLIQSLHSGTRLNWSAGCEIPDC